VARSGTYLDYMLAYSPGLNEIGPVVKQVKHHKILVPSHESREELWKSVEQGFAACSGSLR
jgi:hypothetical protein